MQIWPGSFPAISEYLLQWPCPLGPASACCRTAATSRLPALWTVSRPAWCVTWALVTGRRLLLESVCDVQGVQQHRLGTCQIWTSVKTKAAELDQAKPRVSRLCCAVQGKASKQAGLPRELHEARAIFGQLQAPQVCSQQPPAPTLPLPLAFCGLLAPPRAVLPGMRHARLLCHPQSSGVLSPLNCTPPAAQAAAQRGSTSICTCFPWHCAASHVRGPTLASPAGAARGRARRSLPDLGQPAGLGPPVGRHLRGVGQQVGGPGLAEPQGSGRARRPAVHGLPAPAGAG